MGLPTHVSLEAGFHILQVDPAMRPGDGSHALRDEHRVGDILAYAPVPRVRRYLRLLPILTAWPKVFCWTSPRSKPGVRPSFALANHGGSYLLFCVID